MEKVTLDQGRVSLAKRQVVSLTKSGGAPLSRVRMGLGWDPAKARKSIDLDASCITFDANGKALDVVYFAHKKGAGGAIVHQGDNLTGAGEGDDEVINVDLARLGPKVDAIVFTVNSFRGQKFTEVKRAFCRLIDDLTGQELVRFDLTESEAKTAVIMCILFRTGSSWDMAAVGEFTTGRTAKALVEPARSAHAAVAR